MTIGSVDAIFAKGPTGPHKVKPDYFFFDNQITSHSLNYRIIQEGYIIQNLLLNNRWGVFHPNIYIRYKPGILCHNVCCKILISADVVDYL